MLSAVVVSALATGSFYTLVALGFALIYGVTRNFNLAHGELLVLAGYTAYGLWKTWALPFVLTFPVAIVASMAVCLALQRLFARLGEPLELNSIVFSFGIAILIQNAMRLCFSGNYRLIRIPTLNHGAGFNALPVSYGQLTLLGLSLGAIALLYLFMYHTYPGKALRATIQNREAAALAGINVAAMGILAFAIGGFFIGLAGPLFGCIHYLYPATGPEATLLAVTLTIFAGVGRLGGIILAGWLLALAESITVLYIGSSWREMIPAVLLLGLLALKPRGIFSDDGR